MEIWRSSQDVTDLGGTVVTLGIFDGVHRGHLEILRETVRQARARGMRAVALTFDPHPQQIHNPTMPIPLISTLEERVSRLEAAGIDVVYVQKYSLEYAKLTPEEFITQELIGKLHAKAVVVGADNRFGCNNSGDGSFLKFFGEQNGLEVTLVSDVGDSAGRRFSSTWIRELIDSGNVRQAAEILGRPHRLTGVVQHGFKRGRELGFPTANLPGEGIGEVPADGVYAGWLVRNVPGSTATVHLPAAISIGTNPQFAGKVRTVEAHVLGRSDLNLYGEKIAIEFVDYVRPMLKMRNVAELQNQMDDDLRNVARILGVPVSYRVNPAEVTAN